MATRLRPNPRHLDCDRCYYCEMYLSTRHEHDHFPLQWTFGGEGTVPVCVNCHDLKDRVSLENWPLIAASVAFEEIFDEFVPRGEIDRLSSMDQVPQEYPDWLLVRLRWVAVKETWRALSPIARVLVAKLLVIDQMGRQHAWRTWSGLDADADEERAEGADHDSR